MIRKYSNYIIVGVASVVLALMFSFNVMAAYDNAAPFVTDKSDRTILKEILEGQAKTNALLVEIKGMIQAQNKR